MTQEEAVQQMKEQAPVQYRMNTGRRVMKYRRIVQMRFFKKDGETCLSLKMEDYNGQSFTWADVRDVEKADGNAEKEEETKDAGEDRKEDGAGQCATGGV